MKVFAIDPGNIESGYCLVEYKGDKITKILESGKVENNELLYGLFRTYGMRYHDDPPQLAIELIESYGMAVGRTVFDTCIWTGRFIQRVMDKKDVSAKVEVNFITRREEKLEICKSVKANDSNIRRQLIDLYAQHDFQNGKGTKRDKDFFYGFKADMWAAFAVAHTFVKKKGGKNG